MKLLYEDAPASPWLPDVFWDKLESLITQEKRAAVEEAMVKLQDKSLSAHHFADLIRPIEEVLSEMFPSTTPLSSI